MPKLGEQPSDRWSLVFALDLRKPVPYWCKEQMPRCLLPVWRCSITYDVPSHDILSLLLRHRYTTPSPLLQLRYLDCSQQLEIRASDTIGFLAAEFLQSCENLMYLRELSVALSVARKGVRDLGML